MIARLDQAARRGKVPGFAPGSADVLFECEAFGQPFDGVVQARAQRAGEQTTLRFSTRMNRKMPWIFVIVSILTIWPGVWVTESMLATMFPSAKWLWGTTYWWYLILSVPTTPWYLWSAFKKSRASMQADALERVAEIESLLKS